MPRLRLAAEAPAPAAAATDRDIRVMSLASESVTATNLKPGDTHVTCYLDVTEAGPPELDDNDPGALTVARLGPGQLSRAMMSSTIGDW